MSIVAVMLALVGNGLVTGDTAAESMDWNASCSVVIIGTEACSEGGEVVVGGSVTNPGSDGTVTAPSPSTPVAPAPGGPANPAPEEPSGPPGGGRVCLDPEDVPIGIVCGTPEDEDEEPEPEDDGPVIPPVTVEDVARFAPDPAVPVVEPHGIAVMNGPANVALDIREHAVPGELFGFPMTVTFTPVSISLDYGDGTTAEVGPDAPTWEQLGQEQLTPTATSHVYRERGTFTVSASAAYSAVVDFGALGTFPVNGLVTSGPASVDVRVYELRSGLVLEDCLENPQGPGCQPVS